MPAPYKCYISVTITVASPMLIAYAYYLFNMNNSFRKGKYRKLLSSATLVITISVTRGMYKEGNIHTYGPSPCFFY